MNDNQYIPRLRMFAGPNGSGKSTLKSILPKELLGVYINPDDIESMINANGHIEFKEYQIEPHEADLELFFKNSPLLKKNNLQKKNKIRFLKNRLYFSPVPIHTYWASICADFIRRQLLRQHISFSFETVMSAPDKIELLKIAQRTGYKTYLYYIATEDPKINIDRVKQRVAQGGHNVPEEKIVKRYSKSLEQLKLAVKYSNRSYLFDNSEESAVWICEITDGIKLHYKQKYVPHWFYKYFLIEKQATGESL